MARRRRPAKARVWAAIGLMFFVALLSAAPVVLAGPAEAQVDHHVTATGELDHLAAVGHEHIGPASIQNAPDTFADAAFSRLRIALPVVGLIFAVGVLWVLSPQHTNMVGRDPPRRVLIAFPGRDVLTRLCISRR